MKRAPIIIGLIALAAIAVGFPVFFVVVYALIALGIARLADRLIRRRHRDRFANPS